MQFPKISLVCNNINVDFTDTEPTSYGLSSLGDSLVFEDVLGNQTRQHSFMLYSTFSGINDFERMSNSQTLTELSVWLSKQEGIRITTNIDETEYTGEIIRIGVSGGKLYEVPLNNKAVGLRYQLQIEVQYTVEM
ncbi:MAG: hypothetical protein U0L58_10450 [Ruminococcus sp.]|nr:hypothetical protein [Ruminococcus sp.]